MKRLNLGSAAVIAALALTGCAMHAQVGGWHTKDAGNVAPVTVTVVPNVTNDLYVHVWDIWGNRPANGGDYVQVHVTQLSNDAPDITAFVDGNGWTQGLPIPLYGGNVSILVEYRDYLGKLRTTQPLTVNVNTRGRFNQLININTNPFQ